MRRSPMNKGERTSTSLRLQWETLDRIAKVKGDSSRSCFVENIVKEYLDKMGV